MRILLTACLLFAAVVIFVQADKDTDFYYSGFTNPNVKRKMYWKDAYNVLEDLDQFSALYIKYHNCAHTLYPTPANSGEDEDNEGYDYWYLEGVAPEFRANAAFSLYGILKDGGEGEKNGSYCHKGTYINSFFTNHGVETIAYPFGIGNGVTSQCDGGGGDGDGRKLGGSYGLGCYDGQFVYGQYSGGDCTGSIESVSNSMDNFNSAMESLECAQIYDESGSYNVGAYSAYDDGYGDDGNGDDGYGDDEYNDDGGGRRLEDNEYEEYQDPDPLDILLYSEACQIDLFGTACPDPYGLKLGYEKTLSRALRARPTVVVGRGKTSLEIASVVMGTLGLVLLASALLVRMKYGRRTISPDKGDSLRTPEKMNSPARLISSVSSSASNKARELKEKFQEYAEAEVSEDSDEDPATDAEIVVVDSPTTESPTPDAPDVPKPPSDDSYEKVEPSNTEVSATGTAAAPSTTAPFTSVVTAISGGASAEETPIAPASVTTSSTTKKKKKKRPAMNKISKTLFGKKNNSASVEKPIAHKLT